MIAGVSKHNKKVRLKIIYFVTKNFNFNLKKYQTPQPTVNRGYRGGYFVVHLK